MAPNDRKLSLPPQPTDELSAAQRRIAELEAQLAAKAGPAPKREVVKGTVTYRLTQPHYRKGRYYQPGELLTVTDEAPGKSWVRVEQGAAVEAPVVEAPPPAGRPSDMTV